MKQNIKIFVTSGLFFVLTGCSPLLSKIVGIKKAKYLTDEEIIKTAKMYKIPLDDVYKSDTVYSWSVLNTSYGITDEEKIKNHSQPLQALFYHSNQQLQSFHINCFAGGFPDLKWNRAGNFDVFPPKQQAPVDSLVLLKEQLNASFPLVTTKKTDIQEYDYIVFVFWNRFMDDKVKDWLAQ
jgi:hypothetical protein